MDLFFLFLFVFLFKNRSALRLANTGWTTSLEVCSVARESETNSLAVGTGCVCVCACVRVCVYMYVYVRRACVRAYASIHTCICVRVCACARVCVRVGRLCQVSVCIACM